MRWVKLTVFLVLIGIVAGANLLFKDRLAERALEAGLESLFGARADVQGLRLRLLAGRVELRSLAVADAQEPMTNLFQLGFTTADIDLLPLLSRKVVIESVECGDIRWGTPRSSSGALPGAEAGAAAPAAPAGGLGLPGLDQLGFDPAALIAAEKANLRSPGAYEQANAALREGSGRWQARTAALNGTVDQVGEGVNAIRGVDFGALRSVDEARKAYQAVEALVPVLAGAQKELKGAGGELQADLGKLRAGVSEANALLEQDIRYLRSRVALPQGGLKGAVWALARGLIESKLGRFSSLALRALDAAGSLRSRGGGSKGEAAAGSASAAKTGRRAGRDVAFAATAWPDFVLERFAFSVKPQGGSLAGEIRDVTSDPGLWGKPAGFAADYSAGGRTIQAGGEMLAGSGEPAAALRARGSGMDFALAGLPLVGNAAGVYSFDTTADVSRGSVAGTAVVTTGSVRVGEAQGAAGAVVRDALAGAEEISFDIGYRRDRSGLSLTVASSLDDEVSRQLASRLADLRADYQARAEAELRGALAPELARAREQLGSLGSTAGQLSALDGRTAGYAGEIERKKAEYAAALRRLGGGLLKLPGF